MDSENIPDLPPSPGRGPAVGSLLLGLFSTLCGLLMVGIIPAVGGWRLGRRHLAAGGASRKTAKAGMALSLLGGLQAAFVMLYLAVFVAPHFHFYPGATLHLSDPYTEAAAALPPGEHPRWKDYAPRHRLSLAYAEQWIGCPVPELTLTRGQEEEDKFPLSSLRGKKVLLALLDPSRIKDMEETLQTLSSQAGEAVVMGVTLFPVGWMSTQPAVKPCTLVGVSDLPDLLRPVELPVLLVVDRNGVLQAVYGGKEPVEELRAALTEEDYTGEARPTPPPLMPEPAEPPPSRQLELVKAWSIESDVFSDDVVQNVDDTPEAEFVARSGTDCSVYTSEGKLLVQIPWERERSNKKPVAVTRQDDRFLFAFLESEFGSEEAVLKLLDDKGALLWSRPVESAAFPLIGWFDINGDGEKDVLCGGSGERKVSFFSADGKTLEEWTGELNRSTTITLLEGIGLYWRRGNDFEGASLKCLLNRANGEPVLCLEGRSPYDALFMGAGGRTLGGLEISDGGRMGNVKFHPFWDLHSDTSFLVLTRSFFQSHTEYLYGADMEGKLLWRKRAPKRVVFVEDSVALADYDGDGTSEWVLLGERDLCVYAQDGTLIARAPLRRDSNRKVYTMDRNNNYVEADPATGPSGISTMRVIQRESKPDLILLDEGSSWTAWEIRPVAVN